jgi:zinc transport system permease protein
MRVVGILLIAALMVLPVLTASRIARSVRATLVLAMTLGVGAVFVGLYASFYLDLAPGGTIVLAAAAAFVAVLMRDAVRTLDPS